MVGFGGLAVDIEELGLAIEADIEVGGGEAVDVGGKERGSGPQ